MVSHARSLTRFRVLPYTSSLQCSNAPRTAVSSGGRSSHVKSCVPFAFRYVRPRGFGSSCRRWIDCTALPCAARSWNTHACTHRTPHPYSHPMPPRPRPHLSQPPPPPPPPPPPLPVQSLWRGHSRRQRLMQTGPIALVRLLTRLSNKRRKERAKRLGLKRRRRKRVREPWEDHLEKLMAFAPRATNKAVLAIQVRPFLCQR